MSHVSASFSATIRVRLTDSPGAFARLANAIGEAGGSLGAIDLVRVEKGIKVRDVTVDASDADHLARIVESVRSDGRRRGRARVGPNVPDASRRQDRDALEGSRQDARRPLDGLHARAWRGSARRSHADPDSAWNLTIKQNTVAVVSDGTAVLGLGDIGPEAAMPVMEGKALLFKEFGGVDAWPICLDTKDADEIVADREGDRARLRRHQPGGHLGSALLRDRAAVAGGARHPRLPRRPARDGHRRARGAAQRPQGGRQEDRGHQGRDDRSRRRRRGGHRHPPQRRRPERDRLRPRWGHLRRPRGPERDQAGVRGAHEPRSSPGRGGRRARRAPTSSSGSRCPARSPPAAIERMADDAIVFAMANPTPEIAPEDLPPGKVAVVATGRSDYPNQINNVLAFPGVFRGALDVRASTITEGMKVAAGHAIASVIADDELGAEYVIPSVFNREVTLAVARRGGGGGRARRRRRRSRGSATLTQRAPRAPTRSAAPRAG